MTGPVRLRPKRPCPICRKPSQQKYHPFCSTRCTQIDLSRWLGGSYAIPAEEEVVRETPFGEDRERAQSGGFRRGGEP